MAKRGQFKPGQSGNPKGRPRGARHRTTLAALELLNGEAEALSRKAVELALEGDTTALRLCLERIAPPCREAPVTFEIPEMVTAADASKAMAGLLKAVADGDLVPAQGAAVANLIEAFRWTLETEELERRIERLERRNGR
jgi:hypothetical protein